MNQASSSVKRVMVVEDTKTVAFLMETVLKRAGYTVEIVEHGETCLSRLEEFDPHLIMLDLMLPGIHGIEVLRRLKSQDSTMHIGVIMCTARKYKPDYDQAMELGAFGVMSKPFNKVELISVVKRFFSGGARIAPVSYEFETSGSSVLPVDTEFYTQMQVQAKLRDYFHCWETRGSIPVSGSRFVRHGGNTSCVEVGCDEGIHYSRCWFWPAGFRS